MMLAQLLQSHKILPTQSVPEWMLGCFRRRCISFADGRSDQTTLVFWLQSRNFTIDLRLPLEAEQPLPRATRDYSPEQLQQLANYEGWVADSHWDGELLSWSGGTSLQLHNRWPEPAQLRRIGNCMMEFAPSGIYVEDWRLQPSAPGPLIGLRLVSERDPGSGLETPRDGGLIICGDYAGWVLGRREPVVEQGRALAEQVASSTGDASMLARLLDFETSVAEGALASGYTIRHSTRPDKRGSLLFALDGFEWIGGNRISHTVSEQGQIRERIFEIDTFESHLALEQSTPAPRAAEDWFARESATLTRYTNQLF